MGGAIGASLRVIMKFPVALGVKYNHLAILSERVSHKFIINCFWIMWQGEEWLCPQLKTQSSSKLHITPCQKGTNYSLSFSFNIFVSVFGGLRVAILFSKESQSSLYKNHSCVKLKLHDYRVPPS